MAQTEVKDIRISDPYTKRRLEDIRRERGDATITKTATRLILERIGQLEAMPTVAHDARMPAGATS